MTKCIICRKREAVNLEPWGYLPCLPCRKKQQEIVKPKYPVEMTSGEIKEGRKRFKDDILQPFHDSELSKEYVKKYPDRIKKMIEEKNITEDEVNKAKNVWDDLNYYKE